MPQNYVAQVIKRLNLQNERLRGILKEINEGLSQVSDF